jgi:hypothetical protein
MLILISNKPGVRLVWLLTTFVFFIVIVTVFDGVDFGLSADCLNSIKPQCCLDFCPIVPDKSIR